MIVSRKTSPFIILLSQLKLPIIVLISVMSISMVGLMIIPGQDDLGAHYQLTFLDSFFIVTYTATTIGFGEIPYPFTETQKAWMVLVIYTSVISWIYNIGSIVRVLQNDMLWRELEELNFSSNVKNLKDDFYIVLGFGRTGEWISGVLDSHNKSISIVSKDAQDRFKYRMKRIQGLRSQNKIMYLNADYSVLKNIEIAGAYKENCKGVFIVGRDFEQNLRAQLACKKFGVSTITRAENEPQEKKLILAGGDKVINTQSISILPIYNIFARPHIFTLTSLIDKEFFDTKNYIKLPKKGKFLVYSNNQTLKQKIDHALTKSGNKVVELRSITKKDFEEIDDDIAGIIVAGRDEDNLIALKKCKKDRPDLYTMAINEKYTLSELYSGDIDVDLLIKPWLLFVEQSFTRITEPLIRSMILYLSKQPKECANIISSKIMDIYIDNERSAKTWTKVVEFDMTMDRFITEIGKKEDNVIIFTKKLKDDLSSKVLTKGDSVLISSRF